MTKITATGQPRAKIPKYYWGHSSRISIIVPKLINWARKANKLRTPTMYVGILGWSLVSLMGIAHHQSSLLDPCWRVEIVMLEGWTKGLFNPPLVSHWAFMSGKKNSRKDSNSKEQTPYFVLVEFWPQWLSAALRVCAGTRETPPGCRTGRNKGRARPVAVPGLRRGKRQLGWEQISSQRPSSSCPWKPSASVLDGGIWGIATAKMRVCGWNTSIPCCVAARQG